MKLTPAEKQRAYRERQKSNGNENVTKRVTSVTQNESNKTPIQTHNDIHLLLNHFLQPRMLIKAPG